MELWLALQLMAEKVQGEESAEREKQIKYYCSASYTHVVWTMSKFVSCLAFLTLQKR